MAWQVVRNVRKIRGLKSPVADDSKGLKLMADERFAVYIYIYWNILASFLKSG